MAVIKDKEEEEEDEEEGFEEDDEESIPEPPNPPTRKGRPKKRIKAQVKPENPNEESQVTKRFAVFKSPERAGISDVETNEIVAEGEFAILQVLAEMLERLERIENSVGSMLEN